MNYLMNPKQAIGLAEAVEKLLRSNANQDKDEMVHISETTDGLDALKVELTNSNTPLWIGQDGKVYESKSEITEPA